MSVHVLPLEHVLNKWREWKHRRRRQQRQSQRKKKKTKFAPFVCIPHDDSKPMNTLQLPLNDDQRRRGGGGDAIPEYVREYFADSKSIDVGLLQDQAKRHFAGGQLEELAKTNISASSMASVASQGQAS